MPLDILKVHDILEYPNLFNLLKPHALLSTVYVEKHVDNPLLPEKQRASSCLQPPMFLPQV